MALSFTSLSPKRLGFTCVLIGSVLLIQGCSTLNEKECIRGDWTNIGLNDALNGYTSARLAEHEEACIKYGIAAVESDYQQGFEKGLERFCTTERGYYFAMQGGDYKATCEGDNDKLFLAGYTPGHARYRLESRIDEIERRIQHAQREAMRPPRLIRNKNGEVIGRDDNDRQEWMQTLMWLRIDLMEARNDLQQWRDNHQPLLRSLSGGQPSR